MTTRAGTTTGAGESGRMQLADCTVVTEDEEGGGCVLEMGAAEGSVTAGEATTGPTDESGSLELGDCAVGPEDKAGGGCVLELEPAEGSATAGTTK